MAAMSFADSAQDRILHFLPLHHTHGIVNKLCCPLFGAHDTTAHSCRIANACRTTALAATRPCVFTPNARLCSSLGFHNLKALPL